MGNVSSRTAGTSPLFAIGQPASSNQLFCTNFSNFTTMVRSTTSFMAQPHSINPPAPWVTVFLVGAVPEVLKDAAERTQATNKFITMEPKDAVTTRTFTVSRRKNVVQVVPLKRWR